MLRSRDDRRRRALTEESLRESDAVESSRTAGETPLYAADASALVERRLKELLPIRRRGVAITAVVSFTLTALLLTAARYLPEIAAWLRVAAVPALDPAQANSTLACWTALHLGAATLLSALILSLRHARLDDYRGEYRWWALFLLLAGCATIGTMTPAADLLQAVGQRLSGYNGPAAEVIWWLGPALLLWGTLGIRLLLELRSSPPACAWFGVTLALWTTALFCRLHGLGLSAVDRLWWDWAAQSTAAVSLHLMCLTYARTLRREADGAGGKSKSRSSSRRNRTIADKQLRVDAPVLEKPSPPLNKPVIATTGTTTNTIPRPHFSTNAGDAKNEPEGGKSKLSRAERKRLRQQRQDEDDDD